MIVRTAFVLLMLLSLLFPQAQADRQPFPQISIPDAQVSVNAAELDIKLSDQFAANLIRLPRMHNVVQRIVWLGQSTAPPLQVKPEIDEWLIALPKRIPESRTLRLVLDTAPRVAGERVIVQPNQHGVISLRAQDAQTTGTKLRFEPQAHKNTVGYWTQQADTASWQCSLVEQAEYDVEILQGCGRNNGGSEVDLQIGDQTIAFKVLETGHFQNFRWRHLGRLRLPRGSETAVTLIPRRKAAAAVMDCREIRLTPVSKPWLRKAGRNSDGSLRTGLKKGNRRPNVLLILTDDQGTLDLGCYGSRDLFTPVLDGLANDGVRFTRAYSHTVCCPARAMLMTGRHPQRSGVNSWAQRTPQEKRTVNMAADEVTIAEALKGVGYRTCLSGKWHLGAALDAGPTAQGFDQFFGIRAGFIDNDNHYFLHGDGYHDLYRDTQEVWRRGEYFPDLVTADACRFLEDSAISDPDTPFFLYLSLNMPHYPEQSIRKFDQAYVRTAEPRRSYGQMVSTTDDSIGKVLAELDRLGVREKTIIVFQSDNGHSEEQYAIQGPEHLSGLPEGLQYGARGGGGNTGQWRGCKSTFFEGGLRVPSIISYPAALPSGETRSQAITLCDWMPTLLDLCDVEFPNVKFDGASLLAIINENADSHHQVLHWMWQDKWCVTQNHWKLIGSSKAQPELYRLDGDQPESENVAASHGEVVDQLSRKHELWLQELRASGDAK